MKVKNIAFSGFMASILMAGAAVGETTPTTVPTLATDTYVNQGVEYAIKKAGTNADSKIAAKVGQIGDVTVKSYVDTAKSDAVATAGTNADNKITAKVGDIDGTVKEYVDDTVGALTGTSGSITTLQTDVTNLKTTVGSSTSGLVKDVNTLKSEVETATTGLKDRMTTAENNITNLSTNKANATDVYNKTDADGKFAAKATTLAGYGITDAMTSSAINTAIDTAVAAKDQLSELNDVAITTAANGQVLQYNSTDSKWENASLGTLANKSTITSTEITDGTITNADISGSAAIAQSKIAGLTDALGALTCENGKYCLIVGNTATPYDLAITNTQWTTE